jgi:hypothetical protein
LTKDTEIPKNVYNLQSQIKALKNHVVEYDMADVFTIVVPVDINGSPKLHDERYNLFDDYPKLRSELVGNSNAYYSRWIEDDYVTENLSLSYNLIKNNTNENLFSKCLEEFEMFHHLTQRGGPLILFLVSTMPRSSTSNISRIR